MNYLVKICYRHCRVFAVAASVAFVSGCAAPGAAPVRDGTTPPAASAAPVVPPAQTTTQSGPTVHVVRPGDTLMGVSRLYGINVKDLIGWNNLSDPNQLRVGQEIRVAPPGGVSVQPIGSAQPIEVQPVQQGVEIIATPVKQEPKGGKQPYTDEAWALMQPRSAETPAAATPTPPGTADTPKATPDSAWLWPATGAVLATFNEATNKALDIAGKPGDEVIASAGGKVVYSGSGLRGYGKLVIIKHDANYLTAYAHNQQLLVKEGESVTKGQKIAELGSTDADRPKLHFEIRKQGRPVDPLKYLPAR